MGDSERLRPPAQGRPRGTDRAGGGRTTPPARPAAWGPRTAEQAVLALQRTVGNRAVTGALTGGPGPVVLQRRPGGRPGRGWERMANGAYSVSDVSEALGSPIPPFPKGGDVRTALAAERPGLLGILTEPELDQWQQAVDRSAARSASWDGSSTRCWGGTPPSAPRAHP